VGRPKVGGGATKVEVGAAKVGGGASKVGGGATEGRGFIHRFILHFIQFSVYLLYI
jgi:hypothetical protein